MVVKWKEKSISSKIFFELTVVPIGMEFTPPLPSARWVARQVIQTRYTLQIVKCGDVSCCQPFSTNWMSLVPTRFLPFPAVHKYGPRGLECVEPQEYFNDTSKKLKFAPLTQRLLAKVIITI